MTSPLQQKLKITGPVVITANRLSDGVVIYYAAGRRWVTQLAEAEIATTAEEAARLLDAAQADDVSAVGPYVAPVKMSGDVAIPGNLRESIRRDGPTFPLPSQAGY